jgi:GT2 family glycosyltransferase
MESPVTGKIGVGIITCDRPDLFEKCYSSIPPHAGIELVVVNDGASKDHLKEINNLISQDEPYQGVAKTKNRALQYLLEAGCDHIFLIEDDMIIKDPNIFDAYINASEESGIQHLMFGYHGPANKNGISKGDPCPRLVVDYGNFSLAFNQHCVGAFCYYSRKCLGGVGLIDEKFRNAFDHVSHSYELALRGYSTPYWWWADLANSLDYIEEQACSEENSSIKTPESMQKWQDNIRSSMEYFKEKFGVYPFGREGVPDTDEKEVLAFLKSVKII